MAGSRKRNLPRRTPTGRIVRPPQNVRLIQALQSYLSENLLTVKKLAGLCGVAHVTLHAAFRRGSMSNTIAKIILSSPIGPALAVKMGSSHA